MPVLHAGPSLVSGTWATQRVCWILTAPTLPWPEGPKLRRQAAHGAGRIVEVGLRRHPMIALASLPRT
jgi:hypothetical protein